MGSDFFNNPAFGFSNAMHEHKGFGVNFCNDGGEQENFKASYNRENDVGIFFDFKRIWQVAALTFEKGDSLAEHLHQQYFHSFRLRSDNRECSVFFQAIDDVVNDFGYGVESNYRIHRYLDAQCHCCADENEGIEKQNDFRACEPNFFSW